MKRSPWFYLSLIAIILTVLFFLTSCQKSSLSLVKDTWEGSYVIDTVAAKSKAEAKTLRYDCPGERKWKADTILSYNHGEPEAVAQTWQEITPNDMHWIDDYVVEVSPGYWQRLCFIFGDKKTN